MTESSSHATAGTDHLSQTLFADLPLHSQLQQGLTELGYTRCTPIQARSLPRALRGEDVAGQAQTGTGKTVAFLLATFHHLLTHAPVQGRKPTQPRTLILAPTRELAIQIHDDAVNLGRHSSLKLGLAYGGTDWEKQRNTLAEGCDVLIGTPGRVIDYFKNKVFDFKCCEVVVLDEADRMFDLGFIDDIRYVLRRMPTADQRMNLLFSATLSQRVLELAYEHMNSPELIKIDPERVTAKRVRESMYHVANEEKIPVLLNLINQADPQRALVFVNTKRVGEILEGKMQRRGFNAAVMSGDVPQSKRSRLLKEFHDGKLRILVATDVAARGLHIPDVSHVFNFDLPQDAEDYVHRIGRTARAGAEGDAISLCCETYVYSLPDIEKYIGHKLPTVQVTPELLVPLPVTNIPKPGDPNYKPPHDRRNSRRRSDRRGGGAPRAKRQQKH